MFPHTPHAGTTSDSTNCPNDTAKSRSFSKLAIAGLTGAVAASATIAGVTVAAFADPAGPRSSDVTTIVARDSFTRSLSSGWGKADVGGTYTLSTRSATVSGGEGHVTRLNPGTMFSAKLPSAVAGNSRARIVVHIPGLPSAGSLYASVGLRTQANDEHYLVKARITSAGHVGLSFSRVNNATSETTLGKEVVVPGTVKRGSTLTLEGDASGMAAVALGARAWVDKNASPTNWQTRYSDTAAGRDNHSGYVSANLYLSAKSKPLAPAITDFIAWNLGPVSTPPATNPVTTPPVTTPPVTTPPVTTPPVTTPPVTTPPVTDPVPPVDTTPAAPTTSGPAGSAPLGSTTYSIPAGAAFVSPSGSDSASGAASAPFRTITKAVNSSRAGATIVLFGGTYHETVNIPSNKPMTIQAAPHATVYLDGSSAVSGWTASGSHWVKSGWTAKFDATPSYTGTVSSQKGWGFLNPSYPMAAHPDQVWVDGNALTQVSSAAAVTAGKFFADYAHNQLVLGTNPNGHDVRASDLEIAMNVSSANSTVRGIGIRRFATAVHDMGSVRVTGAGVHFENDMITDQATTGISVLAKGGTISHLTLQRNGLLGMHANYADGITVQNVLSTNNNTEHFNNAPVSGGIKISRTRNVIVRNSVLSDNYGPGLWLDESVYNATVTGNDFSRNAGHGFSFEISDTGVFANNTIMDNLADGIKINDAGNLKIWNNTIGGNRTNLELLQDTRNALVKSTAGHDPRQAFPDRTMPWKIANIQIMNTVLPLADSSISINVRDYTGARSGAQMNIAIDGNLFKRNSAHNDTLTAWPTTKSTITKTRSVADIAKTGVGSHNTEAAGNAAVSNAVAAASAQALPAAVAALIGQATGARHLGAF